MKPSATSASRSRRNFSQKSCHGVLETMSGSAPAISSPLGWTELGTAAATHVSGVAGAEAGDTPRSIAGRESSCISSRLPPRRPQPNPANGRFEVYFRAGRWREGGLLRSASSAPRRAAVDDRTTRAQDRDRSAAGFRRAAVAGTLTEMSALNGDGQGEQVVLTAGVASAERLARAIVFAFESCEEGGVPLSHVQKVAVIEAALLEYDGLEADLHSLTSLGVSVRGLRRDRQRS